MRDIARPLHRHTKLFGWSRSLRWSQLRDVHLSVLIGSLLVVSGPSPTPAMLIPLEVSSASESPAREELQHCLESKVLVHQLRRLGVEEEQVQRRLQTLAQADLHQILQSLDGLQVGGDVLVTSAIVSAVLVGILVLMWGVAMTWSLCC